MSSSGVIGIAATPLPSVHEGSDRRWKQRHRRGRRERLADGGNAVDACIVAAFAAAVAEGPLTGPAGGGFFLAWVDGEATVLDCFFAAPSRPLGEIEEITVDFGDSTQATTSARARLPCRGSLPASRRRIAVSQRPVAQLVEPAIELAAAGFERPTPALPSPDPDRILQRDEGAPIYGPGTDRDGRPRRRRSNASATPAAAVGELLPELADDLAAYRSPTPEPLRTRVGELEVLDDAGALARRRDRRRRARAARRRRDARRARARAAARLRRGSAARGRRDDAHLRPRRRRERRRALLDPRLRLGHLPRRDAAEQHARRVRRHRPRAEVPGERLASMMTPTLVLEDGRPRLRSAARARCGSPGRSRRSPTRSSRHER